ncbi:MAG: DNA repair protein RecO C-terminal domain-containing protein [Flavobacteriales bacterium]|nr:DNA repair protein RecO C-terminal domain-containing protein [Flavobacteriales bacterium]
MNAQRPRPVATRAVVLRTIRHGDRTLVLKAWTTGHGARSYLVRSGGKRGVPEAALQPLTRIELVAEERPDRDIHPLLELRVDRPYLHLARDPLRGAIALFVQEVLYRVLRVESPDAPLDTFVHEALEALDSAPEVRHFPLVFLVGLSGHLGFHPEAPQAGEDHFDLREGHFTQGPPPSGHALGPPLSKALASLLDADLQRSPDPPLPSAMRRELLDHLLLYFRLHVEGMGELRSPDMLRRMLH